MSDNSQSILPYKGGSNTLGDKNTFSVNKVRSNTIREEILRKGMPKEKLKGPSKNVIYDILL
jgi:hypothetical protein